MGYEGTISYDYVKKELIKNSLLFNLIFGGSALLTIWFTIMIVWSTDPTIIIPPEVFILMILFIYIVPVITIVVLTTLYNSAFVTNFSYNITEDNIIIFHGVFTKTRATIPYSRIQNINIANGVFDRMFKLKLRVQLRRRQVLKKEQQSLKVTFLH